MKTYKTVLFLVLVCISLFVVGCSAETQETTEPDTDGNEATINAIEDADSATQTQIATQSVDATITIEDAKISPQEITVPKGDIKILVINNEDTTQRIRIPFYQATVAVDVPAGEEGYIEASPTYPGRVAIELNGAGLGGITVEE